MIKDEVVESTPKKEFYQKLNTCESYRKRVDFFKKVTKSTRLALLWLYIENQEIPSYEEKFSEAELRFLLRTMPKGDLSSVDLNSLSYKNQHAVFDLWLKSIDKPLTAPMLSDELNKSGCWSLPLLRVAFNALLESWIASESTHS